MQNKMSRKANVSEARNWSNYLATGGRQRNGEYEPIHPAYQAVAK